MYNLKMEKIDTLDRKILTILQQEADLPLDAIGDRVGLSRNACWRRIRALEGAGVIRGRVALLDPDRLDLGLMVMIQLRAARHDPDWLDAFGKAVRQMPEIMGAYRMTGDLDYLLRARVRDMADYDRLYRALISRVDLSDVSASFVMETLKDTTALPL
jgi:Lrp/AsnC family transcriptional regulator